MTFPRRGAKHDALEAFVGHWQAVGETFDEFGKPRGPWISTHSAQWHSGKFFLVQDEHANGPFDTLAVMGWDDEKQRYFSRTIENHGHAREYAVVNEGRVWTFTGEHERARCEFSEDGKTQTIAWQWKPGNASWTALCNRVATKVE